VSKAFTKDDAEVPVPAPRRRGVPLPQHVPNYITSAGELALRAELAKLAAGDHDRAHEICEHLATAIVIGAPDNAARVGFGATVTVKDASGRRAKYRLVGAIEAAPRDGAVYWQSPIAEALYGAQIGDDVALPKGEVEVVAIEY
jgi:transcription elongation GreA/GreB family factor